MANEHGEPQQVLKWVQCGYRTVLIVIASKKGKKGYSKENHFFMVLQFKCSYTFLCQITKYKTKGQAIYEDNQGHDRRLSDSIVWLSKRPSEGLITSRKVSFLTLRFEVRWATSFQINTNCAYVCNLRLRKKKKARFGSIFLLDR